MSLEDSDPVLTRRTTLVLIAVCAAIFMETMQFSVLSPVLPELAAEFNIDDVGAGIISSAYAIGLVLFAIPTGRLAARIDERVGVGVGLALIGLANFWFAFAGTASQLVAARFVAGAASAMVWAAGMAWVSSTGPRSTQATRLATVISAAIVGSLVGPVLGTLITVTGRAPVFVFIAVVSLVLIVPTWFLGESHSTVEPSDHGLRHLLSTAALALAITFFIGLFFSALSVMIPLEAVSLGASATVVGFAFIVGSLGQALLGPFIGRLTDKQGAVRVMSLTLSVLAILTFGLVVAPGALGPVVVLAILLPVGSGVYAPSSVAVDHQGHLLKLAPAISFSLWNMLWALGVALGAVVGPLIAQYTGNPWVYVGLAVASGILGVIGWTQRTRGIAVPSVGGG
ncbi:MAG: MFS transporter [Actinobacteria bacterium]|nr:MFS transporter [Actinomycetota bacterium]